MMHTRSWRPSVPPCVRRWTLIPCMSSYSPSSRRRCSQRMFHCGCVHLNTTENSEFLGEPLLLFPLKENEEVRLRESAHYHSLSMKGYHDDGNQAAVFCSADQYVLGRISAARSLLSASRTIARSVVCAGVCARDVCRQGASLH